MKTLKYENAGLVKPLAVCMSLFACSAFAEIRMGTPFSDGAVLQRGMAVPVWGTVAPATGEVKVEFAGQVKSAVVDAATGRWQVELAPMQASKTGRTMTVSTSSEKLEIGDMLVGEVWFASGQSNMECPIWGRNTRYRDMKSGFMADMTRLPFVRYIKSPKKWSVEPIAAIDTKWHKFDPEGLKITYYRDGGLSAVAFYYARELYLALDIPIGIVDVSWGGTNIDAWTPRSGYNGCDERLKFVADYPVKSAWKAETDKLGAIRDARQQPTVIWNGMVAAYAPMAMRGFIWYQGCNNAGHGEDDLYSVRLHALYEGWRREFSNPELRHYLVQLAPHRDNWLGICMAQNRYVAEEKNAAIAVTADVGNFRDIHPNDKEIVAKRLVLHALKRDYGFDIPEDDSPVCRSAEFADGKATLHFDHVKSWYVYAPDRSRNPAFELAGEDGEWQPAKVANYRQQKGNDGKEYDTDYIDGADIVLQSEKVANPVKVRYMGRSRTSGTMYNEASLPLGPFEFPHGSPAQ
jgi:sialate O-acetylesterase